MSLFPWTLHTKSQKVSRQDFSKFISFDFFNHSPSKPPSEDVRKLVEDKLIVNLKKPVFISVILAF